MSLIVGKNTYVTLEEAERIISNSFISSDKAYQKWQTLSNGDKEVLLQNSCRDIDNLKFEGRRKNLSQTLEFPRVDASFSPGIGYALYIGQFYDNGLYSSGSGDGGLSLVKQAQVQNAVCAGLYNDNVNELMAMNIQGLTSKRAGPIAESYNRNSLGSEDALLGIFTKKVYSILRPWLNDSRITY